MRWFAEISLAVYVVHETVIRLVPLVVYGPLAPGVVQQAGQLILMPRWGAAASLPISILLGWMLTHGFEKPLNRRILKRVSAAPKAARTSTPGPAPEI